MSCGPRFSVPGSQNEGVAREAYEAFCAATLEFQPPCMPAWEELPATLQKAWAAAAAAVLRTAN